MIAEKNKKNLSQQNYKKSTKKLINNELYEKKIKIHFLFVKKVFPFIINRRRNPKFYLYLQS